MDNSMKIDGDSVILAVNPKVYPLDTVYSAAYVFLDRAYILLDGDPEKEILVRIKPKEKKDMEKLGGEFFNELINYGDYKKRAEQTKKVREMLMQRALITNDPSLVDESEEESFEDLMEELDEDDALDDPEGIAIPWEEKHGSDSCGECNDKNENPPEQ